MVLGSALHRQGTSATPLDQPGKRRVTAGNRRGAWLFLLPAAAIYIFIVLWPSIRGAGLTTRSNLIRFIVE